MSHAPTALGARTGLCALLAAAPLALCLRCLGPVSDTARYCRACLPFAPKEAPHIGTPPSAGRYPCAGCAAPHRPVARPGDYCPVCDGPGRRETVFGPPSPMARPLRDPTARHPWKGRIR